jgi:hypothetical protein
MRRWMPTEPDLFKTPMLNELPPPQRTAALDLLKALLTEVISVAEAGARGAMGDQEAGDDQDHA